MRLLLTSTGFVNKKIADVFLKQLAKPVEKCRVLIVAYAINSQEQFYVDESVQEIKEIGFKDVIVLNMHYPIDVNSIINCDAIYVCGGNTFAILNKLRETKLDKLIINQVNLGAFYIGVSAGSIIAGPNIEISGWGTEGDKNEIGLEDLSGFNFTGIVVFPHFHEELRSEVEEFRKKVKYRVMELTDNQAIFIDDLVERVIE